MLIFVPIALNAADWFKDVPWFNIPPTMSGLLVEPVRPPLRLMGGSAPSSAKPSKLAALAAAQKKKEADLKAAQSQNTSQTADTAPASALSLLDRLGGRDSPGTSLRGGSALSEPAATIPQSMPRTYPLRKKRSPSPPPKDTPKPPDQVEELAQEPAQPKQQLRSSPSVFAETMCGDSNHRTGTSETSNFSQDMLATLYGRALASSDANPFSGPSPDDVVTQAQAKGLQRS